MSQKINPEKRCHTCRHDIHNHYENGNENKIGKCATYSFISGSCECKKFKPRPETYKEYVYKEMLKGVQLLIPDTELKSNAVYDYVMSDPGGDIDYPVVGRYSSLSLAIEKAQDLSQGGYKLHRSNPQIDRKIKPWETVAVGD